jgi:3D (Asp-Asp-Asp) domain-containing protein
MIWMKKDLFSKPVNILSVAVVVAGLTFGSCGLYVNNLENAYNSKLEIKDNKIEHLNSEVSTKSRANDSLSNSLYIERNRHSETKKTIVKLEDNLHKLEKENSKLEEDKGYLEDRNDYLKKKVRTYEDKSESPSVSSIPSRGESAKNKRSVNVVATAYTAFCNTGCSGVTRTGLNVSGTTHYQGSKIIAVDPSVIPLHSKVKVETKGGTFYATAQDTGGDIKNARIDVLVSSESEAIKFGRQSVKVTILREGK